MASTMASSVSRLRLKPSASITDMMPTSDSGMVTIGMITERGEPRKRKMTMMTMTAASSSVHSTSLIEDWMKTVPS